MQLGLIGLGKMGGNMVLRLTQGGQQVVGYDRSEENVALVEAGGAGGARTMDELIGALGEPGQRAVWVMVPSGQITQSVIDDLAERLAPGDIVVDGGNSNYKDSMRRAQAPLQPARARLVALDAQRLAETGQAAELMLDLRGDEGAGALTARDQALFDQHVHGLAQGHA